MFQFQIQCSESKVIIVLDIFKPLLNFSCFTLLKAIVMHIFNPFCLLNACKSNCSFSNAFSKTQLLNNPCSQRPTRSKMRTDENSKTFSSTLLTSLKKAKDFYWLLCLSLYQSHYMLSSLTDHIFGRCYYHPNTRKSKPESTIQESKCSRTLPSALSLEWE